MLGVRSRFLREARAAAQIRHPNVARVSHYGEQDGECFYVMEWSKAKRSKLRSSRRSNATRSRARSNRTNGARIGCRGSVRVVHRDIKPSNIMLESDPGGCAPIVKVIDTGLLKSSIRKQNAAPKKLSLVSSELRRSRVPSVRSFRTHKNRYAIGYLFVRRYLLVFASGRVPFVGRTLNDIRLKQTEPLPTEQLKVGDVRRGFLRC